MALPPPLDFDALPLVAEGESKIVRYLGGGRVAIRLKPTIYSYTANRYGVIPGTERLRLSATDILCGVIARAGLRHCFHLPLADQGLLVADLLLEPTPEGYRFAPDDVALAHLARIPPIEVIVKAAHVGTPKHRYYNLAAHPTRDGELIADGEAYPAPIVRFDWRNPLTNPAGERLADEPMPDSLADLWIDTRRAADLARRAFAALSGYMAGRGLRLLDICFLIDASGERIFSEISPDCMRVTAAARSLDKDVWRGGGAPEQILRRWATFVELIR